MDENQLQVAAEADQILLTNNRADFDVYTVNGSSPAG